MAVFCDSVSLSSIEVVALSTVISRDTKDFTVDGRGIFEHRISPGRYEVTTMYVAVVDPAAFTGNKLVYSCGGTRNGDLIRITENYSNFYDRLKIAKRGSKGRNRESSVVN